jgi:hypothetical protein
MHVIRAQMDGLGLARFVKPAGSSAVVEVGDGPVVARSTGTYQTRQFAGDGRGRRRVLVRRRQRSPRSWEFYLACAEAGFRHQNLMVFQIQLAKRHDAVPITRDYIARAEARLRQRERRRTVPVRLAGE